MTFLFAKNGEKLRESRASAAGRKLYRSRGGLLFHSVAAVRAELSQRPAEERRKSAGKTEAEGQSKLLRRAYLVAVIPIDGWIGRGIVFDFGGVGLILLSLRALFFLHLALLDALHFFLPLLKCRGHKPLLTAECGEGPGPAVQPIHGKGKLPARFARLAS
jgi:hypothetical protein